MKKLLLKIVCYCSIAGSLNAQIPNYVPTNSLVAFYPFNANAMDASNNGFHGAVNTATLTQDRFGNANNSYSFTSSSGGIIVSSLPMIDSVYSVSFWFKKNLTNVHSRVLSYNWQTNQGQFVYYIENDNTGRFGTRSSTTGTSIEIVDNVPISTNVWFHIVCIRNNSTMILYKNGVQLSVITNTFILPGQTQPFYVGGDPNQLTNPYTGAIDDIIIYDRALSQCEVNQLYTSSANTIDIVSSNPTICEGQTTTLTASGGTSYTWTSNNLTGNSLVINPTITTTYSINAITNSSLGCISTATISQIVSNCVGVEILSKNDLEIYCFENFIRTNSTDQLYLKVLDLTGKQVLNTSFSENIKLDLNNGIYFIRVFSQNENLIEQKRVLISE